MNISYFYNRNLNITIKLKFNQFKTQFKNALIMPMVGFLSFSFITLTRILYDNLQYASSLLASRRSHPEVILPNCFRYLFN